MGRSPSSRKPFNTRRDGKPQAPPPQRAERPEAGRLAHAPSDAVKARIVEATSTTDPLSQRTATIILALILLMAFAVRFVGIDSKSLWADELWTISASNGRDVNGGLPRNAIIEPPIPRVTSTEGADSAWRVFADFDKELTQPPLYFVLLRLWRGVFGDGDIAARMLSVVCALIAIVLIYDVGRLLAGRTTGLWAAALLGLASPQILYALEVRNYTIQHAIALAGAAILLRIEKSGASWGRVAGFGVAILAMVLTHYFALGIAIALGLYAMLRLRGSARFKTVGAMLAAALLFIVIWGPTMLAQRPKFTRADNEWLFDETPGRWWRAMHDTLLVPAQLITRLDKHTLILGYILAAIVVASFVLWRRRRDLQLPLLWIACGIGLITAMDVTRSSIHLFFIRYTTTAGIGVYLLIAALLAPLRGYRHVLPALACIGCVWALPSIYSGPYEKWRPGIEDWRLTARFVADNVAPGDLVIFSADASVPLYAHVMMLGTSHYLGTIQVPIIVATVPPDERLLRKIAAGNFETIWIFTYPTRFAHSENVIPGSALRTIHIAHESAAIFEVTWNPPAGDDPGPHTLLSRVTPAD